MNVNQFGKGCIPQPIDKKDFKLESVASAFILPEEYSIKDKVGKIKHQDGSLSCVGQSFAYYAEVLNLIETNQKTELSARDIYSSIFVPEGGAWLRDACKRLTQSGVAEEVYVSSYLAGKPPTEAYMRLRNDITSDIEENAMTYITKSYVSWDTTNFETFKRAIYEGNGCVIASYGNNSTWGGSTLSVPLREDCNWAHATYCTGWKVINGKEYLEFVNSWGEDWGAKGFGLMPKEYITSGLVFNAWTMVDNPNNTYSNMKEQIRILTALVELWKQLIAMFKK